MDVSTGQAGVESSRSARLQAHGSDRLTIFVTHSTRIKLVLLVLCLLWNGIDAGELSRSNWNSVQGGTWSGYTSNNAYDGVSTNCAVACTTCDPSGDRGFAWWQVDLSSNFTITSVALTGSNSEPDYQYLQYFEIWLAYDNITDVVLSQGQVCYNFNNGSIFPQATETTINCTQPVTGRYLTIKRNGGSFRTDALTICEVRLFGYLFTTTTTYPPTTTTITTTTSSSSSSSSSVQSNSLSRTTTTGQTGFCNSCCQENQAVSADITDKNVLVIVIVLGSLLGICVLVIVVLIIACNIKIRQLLLKIKHLSRANDGNYSTILDNEPIIYEPMVEYSLYSTIRTYGHRSRRHMQAMTAFNARRRSRQHFPDYYPAGTFNFEPADPAKSTSSSQSIQPN